MTYKEQHVAAKLRLQSTTFLKPAIVAAFMGISTTSALLPTVAAAQTYSFTAVQIEGLDAIEADTVMTYLGFGRGEPVSAAELNDAYKRLVASGLFDTVTVDPRGSTLVVKVAEFPLINRINIEGNKALKDDQLLALLQSQPRYVFNPATAEQDAETIAQAYADKGRIAAQVEPVIIRRAQNRVDLVFEVVEGKNTEIERITFTGNRAFSDARLRRVIGSKQAGILRFFVSADTFDPGRVEFDKQLLADFYASRGYVDFDAVAVTSEVAPQEDGYFVTYEIREGQQFSFGAISTATEVEGIDPAAFEGLARIREGATYNPAVVDRATARMEKQLQQDGYGFVRVDPRITRNERDGTLDIAFTIVRGPRIVVERIDIEGNETTLDRVVRQQFTTVEGDPFNPRAIRAAAERIRALGYFANVDVQAREGSSSDSVIVDVNVEEQGTGAFSFGATYALGQGFGFMLAFSETNFLGRGQYLNLEFSGGLDNRNYAVSFAEPNLFGRDLRLGFSGFYNQTTWQEGLFDSRQFAVEPSLEFPLSETGRLRVLGGVEGAEVMNYVGNSPTMLAEQARGFQYGGYAGAKYSFDTRRNGLGNPTNFYGEVAGTVGGLGADSQYAKATALANVTTTAINDSITLSATVEGGMIRTMSGAGTRVTDRFMMSPDDVLGFGSYGMGPRDLAAADDDALGGNYYGAARLEARFPIGLPEEYNITGGVFVHAGSVWGLDNSPGVDDDLYIRASGGAALYWETPIGPLRFSYAYPFMKEAYDVEQRFGVSISTGF
ncbi:outer membrane protein assembly factor BamA [Sinisalibacter aestuarii]|uniref:Outer membrane protein assembly factor BamA n=1 Tax=Sinisalibacter aestuarii TaxID=2949426 RepID=A0ABQ5LSM4_9RHOB|nr:outer membrane protein assembly factor BamA [Sinisalibacter aestuarii]GKY87618.1 outer membrane protein assembly factor BamA [Sinisalibacter aestuarii]